jgi:hypothetical protein
VTALRSGLVILGIAFVAGGCGPAAGADAGSRQERLDALEARVAALESAAASTAVDRSDAALAATLSVVQSVGRGMDPTALPSADQVGFCRATGWTIRDLAAVGHNMRAAGAARDAAIQECRAAGVERPTEEQVRGTEAGQRWLALASFVGQVHEQMEKGQWAEARKLLAPRAPPPAKDGERGGG